MDKETYKKYKRRIENAVAKTDNKPPRFDLYTYYKPQSLSNDVRRAMEIDLQNMKLLKQMNIITRFGGKVDCWLSKRSYKLYPSAQMLQSCAIAKDNKLFLKRIRAVTSVYNTKEFINEWKRMKILASENRKYQKEFQVIRPQLNKDHCMVRDPSLLKELKPSIRTRCFFEIEIQQDKQKLGSIQFELYDDVVPRTCTNFAELCRGTTRGLSYKNTPFHRIVSGYWCQGGDVTKFNGSGGASIYEESLENENFNLRHVGPGVLSMYNETGNECNSKFNLTFRRLDTMDEKHVVFGKVISGLGNIYKIDEFGTKTGKPIKTIVISNCGVIPRKNDKGTVKKQT